MSVNTDILNVTQPLIPKKPEDVNTIVSKVCLYGETVLVHFAYMIHTEAKELSLICICLQSEENNIVFNFKNDVENLQPADISKDNDSELEETFQWVLL